MIDHRRGLADSDHEEPMSSLREIDDSNRFQEYDDILVNNDWSFHTTEEIRPRPQGVSMTPTSDGRVPQHGQKALHTVPTRHLMPNQVALWLVSSPSINYFCYAQMYWLML